MFGPLSFPDYESSKCKSQFVGIDDDPLDTQCLLCEASYILPDDQKNMLTHFFQEHRLVIGDVDKIMSLKRCLSQFVEISSSNHCQNWNYSFRCYVVTYTTGESNSAALRWPNSAPRCLWTALRTANRARTRSIFSSQTAQPRTKPCGPRYSRRSWWKYWLNERILVDIHIIWFTDIYDTGMGLGAAN